MPSLFSSGPLLSSLMSRIYDDNGLAIGNTPLVKLNSVTKNCKATAGHVEGRNPATASSAGSAPT